MFETSAPRIPDDRVLRIDNSLPPFSADLTSEVERFCDRIEDAVDMGAVLVRVGSSMPTPDHASVGVRQVKKWEGALRRLERSPALTVAVAEQNCTGPAFEALLVCDYRIARPCTEFALPIVGGTPWPGTAIHRLATQVGAANVRRTVLFGTPLTASAAGRIGLVDTVTDDVDAALTELWSWSGSLAGSEVAVRRRLLLEASSTGFDESLGTHLSACDRTLRRATRDQEPVAP
ncbi:enoyl-CoA-hydratase DpgB [Nocardia sp. NPDC051570]|uniref:enoyl-CoA-hydratase DpgB n=1 Tax=Nocardia sp. NPDC051570 TaxID=3364324 RepID=UPI0037936F9C